MDWTSIEWPEEVGPAEAIQGRQWMRDQVSDNMRSSPIFGMLADLEALSKPFFLGDDRMADDEDFDEGPF